MTVKAITWLRDSHGLFDYEYKTSVTKDAFKLNEAAQLIRVGNEVKTLDTVGRRRAGDEIRSLATLNFSESDVHTDIFTVTPAETVGEEGNLERTQYEKMYLVVKTLKTNGAVHGYQLSEGDVLRLGRAKFRVKEFKGDPPTTEKVDFSPSTSKPGYQNFAEEEPEEDEEARPSTGSPCRVCLAESTSVENPLLSPCHCSGTMRLIHLECLQHWLRSRLTTKASANVVSFSWKTLDCELCKKSFPSRIIIQGRVVDLLDIPKPESQYIILEGLCKDKNSPKSLHVVSMNGKSVIKMGRGHESELRVSDISVSRCHASLKLHNGNFYLDDENSKFGTLIQVKRPISLEMMEQLTVQTGRTLLSFDLKKPWTLIPACFRPTTTAFDFYNAMGSAIGGLVLPVNTGIPLTCGDPKELMSYVTSKPMAKYKQHTNLMYNHNEIGVNSSCGEEGDQDVLEEMEVVLGDPQDPLDDPQNDPNPERPLTPEIELPANPQV